MTGIYQMVLLLLTLNDPWPRLFQGHAIIHSCVSQKQYKIVT